MAITIKGGGADFVPHPVGMAQAVCVDVVDNGLMETNYPDGKKVQPKVTLYWQSAKLMENGRRFLITKRYTNTTFEMSAHAADLLSGTGKVPEEGFDLETLIGRNALLNVAHNNKNNKTYANVVSVNPVEGFNLPLLAPVDYVRKLNRPVTTPAATHTDEPPPHTDADFAQVASEEDEGLTF